MEKKEKKIKKVNKIKYETSEQHEVKSFLVVVLVVLVAVGLTYLATRMFVSKDLFTKDDNEEAASVEVNYDVAIVGNILNRPYDEYYVVVYDSRGDYAADMTSVVSEYTNKAKHLHVYTVDLANALNVKYYNPTNINLKVSKVSDFRFGDVSLLKVKKGKVNNAWSDIKKIKKELV